MTDRMTISMPDELADRINGQLSWGDNRSELVRELLREALDERETVSDDLDIRERVARVDWDQTRAATYNDAREAAIADAVRVIAVGGVASRRTVKQIIVRSDRDLGLKETSRERIASDLVPEVEGVVPEGDSDLVWRPD